MQDYSFLDDYDYTLCAQCHSSIQPYNNTSITTISSILNSNAHQYRTINISITTLKDSDPFIKTLISYDALHCHKCGLYIEIHPKHDDEVSSKIFICSNTDPHQYCLCYHCGLLYGINPNQKSIDIITLLQNNLKIKSKPETQQGEEEPSMDREVADDDNDRSTSDDDAQESIEIDESYMHIIQLKNKLNLLSHMEGGKETMSCPSSPNNKTLSWNISQSLRGSPLLGPSTPSPRVLEKNIDESEKKWQQYLSQQHETIANNNESTNAKLEKQQKKLEELEKLQKELSIQKRNSEQYAKLFREGIYSKENAKMPNFKLQT
eukprot:184906_1